MFYAIVIVLGLAVLAGVVAYLKIPAVKKEITAIKNDIEGIKSATQPTALHAAVAKAEKQALPAGQIVQPTVVANHVKAVAATEAAAKAAADHAAAAEQALADKNAGKLVPAPAAAAPAAH